jgi:uncharacterized protein YjiS (DUF1127 family)
MLGADFAAPYAQPELSEVHMQLSREHQAALERRARRLGSVVPRCTEVVCGYAGGVVLYVREPIPVWDVVLGAAGGFAIMLTYLVMLLRGNSGVAEAGVREWSRALLDQMPGWRRLDDVALSSCDADHVIATPAGLVVVVTKWRLGMRDLALAAAIARRVRRLTALAPNALDVPVHAALLLWGPGNEAVARGWDEATGVYVLDANQPANWPAELTGTTRHEPECRPADLDEALRKVRGWSAYHRRRLGLRRLAMILLGDVRRGMDDRRAASSVRA